MIVTPCLSITDSIKKLGYMAGNDLSICGAGIGYPKGKILFVLQKRGKEKNVMGIILIIILVIVLIGALPTWPHSKSWGPYPSGGIGLILLILLILLLLGRI